MSYCDGKAGSFTTEGELCEADEANEIWLSNLTHNLTFIAELLPCPVLVGELIRQNPALACYPLSSEETHWLSTAWSEDGLRLLSEEEQEMEAMKPAWPRYVATRFSC